MPSGISKNGTNKGWFKKNHIGWNKDIPCSDGTKKKISISNTGKKRTNEVKEKQSQMLKGKCSGDKNPNWKDGRTPTNKRIRNGIEFRIWRELVFERDDWTCQKCLISSGSGKAVDLNPHHIQNFSNNDKLRFDTNNGMTLCRDCHYKFHKMYGYQDNTREQLQEFLL